MTAYNYNWEVTRELDGQFSLTTDGINCGSFDTEEAAVEFARRTESLDEVECKSRELVSRMITTVVAPWGDGYGLAPQDVLESIRDGIELALDELCPKVE